MNTPAEADQSLQAIVWVTFGMVLFSLQDIVIKWVSAEYPLHEVVFFRSCFGIVLATFIAHLEGGINHLRTKRFGMHFVRGSLIVVANSAYFVALATMPLAETMGIFFVAPLFITALSVPFLGERVGWHRWLAVGVGLAGVLLMVRPSTDAFDWVVLLPVLAAFAYASTQILTKPLGKTDWASAMSFYVMLFLLAFSAIVGLVIGDGKFSGGGNPNIEFLVRAWKWPNMLDLSFFAVSGFITAIGGFALSQAYRIGPATTIAPFEYLALPFAVLWGFLFWGDFPDAFAFAGIALIVGAGLFVVYREKLNIKL